MTDKLYYDIIEKDGRFEFHISRDRQKVLDADSLSRSIKSTATKRHRVMKRWGHDIGLYSMIHARGEHSVV